MTPWTTPLTADMARQAAALAAAVPTLRTDDWHQLPASVETALIDLAWTTPLGEHRMLHLTLSRPAGSTGTRTITLVEDVTEERAATERLADGSREVTLRSDRFLYGVSFDVKDFLPDDNYFHLSPLRPKIVRFTPAKPGMDKFGGYVEALNLQNGVRIT